VLVSRESVSLPGLRRQSAARGALQTLTNALKLSSMVHATWNWRRAGSGLLWGMPIGKPEDGVPTAARFAAWLARNKGELRLVLRITAASLLAFWIAHMLELHRGYWAVLTAVIIIQVNLGGSLKAAVDRLAGTLSGGAYGALIAILLPETGLLWRTLALALGVAPLALLAAFRPRLRLAPVTAIIVLLGGVSQTTAALPSAIDRMTEIGLGSAIGFAVSLFVLPTRAHSQLKEDAVGLLESLAELTPLLLAGLTQPQDSARLNDLNQRIHKALDKLDGLAEEARQERASRLADEPDPEPLRRSIRRLCYDFVMIGRAASEPLPPPIAELLAEPLADASAALVVTLSACSRAIATRRVPPPPEALVRALAQYEAAMGDLGRRGLFRELASEPTMRVFGLAFALGQVSRDIDDLAERARELAGEA